jgi:RNA polymerase sigma-70 factor (ECF subfamily)
VTVMLDKGDARRWETGRDDDVDMARDRALITRAQAGDRTAFDELYLHYSRRLYRLCLRRLSDPHEAEDVAQEAFVRAWRALPRFCGERRFYPWLSVIAANLCTDVLRKRSRSTPVAEFFGADPDTGEELDDKVLHEVDAAMVGEALTKLNSRHRRILSLREERGMTYQAIAEHEGLAVSAVETLLWRARQALKREFTALAEAAEGKGAALVGLGVVGRLLSRLLRLPVHGAKRLGHLSPASAVFTVSSISAVGALCIGVVTRSAPQVVATSPSQYAALGTQAVAGQSGTGLLAAPGDAGSSATPSGVATSSGPVGAASGGAGRVTGSAVGGAADGASGAGSPAAAGASASAPTSPSGSSGGGLTSGGTGGLSGLIGAVTSGMASGSGTSSVAGGVGSGLASTVSGVAGAVGSTVNGVTNGVAGGVGSGLASTVSGVAGAVGSTVNGVTKGVAGVVGGVVGGAGGASSAGGTVSSTVSGVTSAVAGAVGAAPGVTNAVSGSAGAVSSTVSGVTRAVAGAAPGSSAPPPPASPTGAVSMILPSGIGGLLF